ncbi:MAG: glycosyltransferase family 39 protein [Candidatus Eisenbacteria bacterium]|nr:glycosyltransferase family 39 protein [Candidatus Eisenbacteria bacterium]
MSLHRDAPPTGNAAGARKRVPFGDVFTIGLAALGARLFALPGSGPETLGPDSAHFLNVARCFVRGQGFSNVEAWPSWMHPARLPSPETFKEPAYSWLIAAGARLGCDPFATGRMIALLAGILIPWLTYALARAIHPERRVALLAGLLAACSPLLIQHSVVVTADTLFAALTTAMFLAACEGARATGAVRRSVFDLATGACFGLAYLTRAQVMLAVPALLVLWLGRPTLRSRLQSVALAFSAAVVLASPLLLRNLRQFGEPLHSDVVRLGILPYLDQFVVYNSIDLPPAAIPYALAHPAQVAARVASSLQGLALSTFPHNILGHPVWMLQFVAGLLLGLGQRRALGFAYLYGAVTVAFIAAVWWAPYYFCSLTPIACLFTAIGAGWIADRIGDVPLAGPVTGGALLFATLAVTLLLQVGVARRDVRAYHDPELAATLHEAPFLRAHLAPGESVMVMKTSYWAWFTDHPAVSFTLADEPRFMEVIRRLRVRYAALPTSLLPKLAARSPSGRLPRSLVFDHADSARDVTVFRIEDPAGAEGGHATR